jgi:exodeoxyribonuclease-5
VRECFVSFSLLLMGDTAQLPPVGEEQSPALFADALKGYGLEVQEVDLTQVVRQEQQWKIIKELKRFLKTVRTRRQVR